MTAAALAALLLAAATPPPATPPAEPEPDAELLRHLDELEQLDLLRNLELFDPGDEEPEQPAPSPEQR